MHKWGRMPKKRALQHVTTPDGRESALPWDVLMEQKRKWKGTWHADEVVPVWEDEIIKDVGPVCPIRLRK